MFLNWQDSSKSVLVVLMFRAGQRMARVPAAMLARLPLARRTKVRLVTPDVQWEG
jgi:hypothetical protein